MANGRYPYKSAYGITRLKLGTPFGFMRKTTRWPTNDYTMWQNWFLSSDGIGFGVMKRWNGTQWVECTKWKVNAF